MTVTFKNSQGVGRGFLLRRHSDGEELQVNGGARGGCVSNHLHNKGEDVSRRAAWRRPQTDTLLLYSQHVLLYR